MAYRDDDDVLHDRLDELRSEADRIEQQLRDRGAGPRRLPLLDRVRVASPCHEAWDRMVGDARERLCASCTKTVYNLSEMTRAEAEAFLQARLGVDGNQAAGAEGLCVRLYRRTDGTLLTADCPVGVRKKRTRRVLFGAAGVGALAAGAFASAAFAQGRVEPAMGAVAVVPGPDDVREPVMGEIDVEPEEHLDVRMGDVAVDPARAPGRGKGTGAP